MRQRDIHSHLHHRETQPRHLRVAGRDALLQPGGGGRAGPNGPRRKKKNPAPTLELKKYPSPLGLERESFKRKYGYQVNVQIYNVYSYLFSKSLK